MLEEAVHEAAEDANDPDAAAALRQQIKRAIREDEELRRELAGLLTSSATLTPIVGSQTATARDRGVVFQQGTGRQTYESK
jgi:hypothetical protein